MSYVACFFSMLTRAGKQQDRSAGGGGRQTETRMRSSEQAGYFLVVLNIGKIELIFGFLNMALL